MRGIGTILTAGTLGVLLLAGCSGEDDPAEGTTTDQAQTTEGASAEAEDDAASGVDTADGDTATEDTATEDTATDDTATDDTATETEVADGDGGGSDETGAAPDPDAAPEEVLEQAGLLDGQQVVVGPGGVDDPTVQAAICDYVVGTQDEVAAITGVSDDLTPLDGNGYTQRGGNGGGIQCVYDVDGADGFGIVLWSKEIPNVEDGDETQLLASGPVGEHWGTVAYAPTFAGEVMDEAAAAAWLEDAATRWGGASA